MMSLTEFFQRFHLHDAGVDSVEYRSLEGIFRIHLELCNYDQSFYREGEPELLPGWMEFKGVTNFSANLSLPSIQWGPSLDGEILLAELVDSSMDAQTSNIKFVISLMDYRSKEKNVLVINFRGSTAQWIPSPVSLRRG